MATKSENFALNIVSGSTTLEQINLSGTQTVQETGFSKTMKDVAASTTYAIAVAAGSSLIIYAKTITGTVKVNRAGSTEIGSLLTGDTFRMRATSSNLGADVVTSAASTASLTILIIPGE